MVKIKIILGSTRPERFGIQPAQWILEQAKAVKDATFELVDLEKINLPLLDEPVPALMGKYSKAHTKEWSEVVVEADGFIFVAAEYNHSIPAALKNALDFLNHEWNFKPASFVSYGSAAGGARSVEHLRAVCGELKMYNLREQLLMPNYWLHQNKYGRYEFTSEQVELAAKIITDTVFWATKLKPIRQEIIAKK